jgi:arylsulfatase A-like enzyme
VVADPVGTLDLAPTFLDLAGVAPARPLHGASLAPLWRGEGGREVALSEWELLPARTGVALSLRVARGRRWKLTLELRSGAGELYDLETDPHECVNRFGDPACAAEQAVLEAAIRARPADAGPLRVPVGTA